MSNWDDNQLPEELRAVAEQMREQRAYASPLELDRIKLRAKAQASKPAPSVLIPKRGMAMKTRVATLALTALLIGGTTAGGIAANGGGNNGNSADSQYRPGLGCGDKNHTHTGPPGNPDKECKK
jgi:hypothetical protein